MRYPILPVIMIALQFSAGIVFVLQGNYRMGGYWLSACALTSFITF